MTGLTIDGVRVEIPRYADIPSNLRPGGKHWRLVEEALHGVGTWEDRVLIDTVTHLSGDIPMTVVRNMAHTPMWGIHRGHKADNPKLSPFVLLQRTPNTRTLSFEFDKGKIVRIMPGEYIPPLPWQTTAKKMEGGTAACREFWCSHSYVWSKNLTTTALSSQPPTWFNS